MKVPKDDELVQVECLRCTSRKEIEYARVKRGEWVCEVCGMDSEDYKIRWIAKKEEKI